MWVEKRWFGLTESWLALALMSEMETYLVIQNFFSATFRILFLLKSTWEFDVFGSEILVITCLFHTFYFFIIFLLNSTWHLYEVARIFLAGNAELGTVDPKFQERDWNNYFILIQSLKRGGGVCCHSFRPYVNFSHKFWNTLCIFDFQSSSKVCISGIFFILFSTRNPNLKSEFQNSKIFVKISNITPPPSSLSTPFSFSPCVNFPLPHATGWEYTFSKINIRYIIQYIIWTFLKIWYIKNKYIRSFID